MTLDDLMLANYRQLKESNPDRAVAYVCSHLGTPCWDWPIFQFDKPSPHHMYI